MLDRSYSTVPICEYDRVWPILLTHFTSHVGGFKGALAFNEKSRKVLKNHLTKKLSLSTNTTALIFILLLLSVLLLLLLLLIEERRKKVDKNVDLSICFHLSQRKKNRSKKFKRPVTAFLKRSENIRNPIPAA